MIPSQARIHTLTESPARHTPPPPTAPVARDGGWIRAPPHGIVDPMQQYAHRLAKDRLEPRRLSRGAHSARRKPLRGLLLCRGAGGILFLIPPRVNQPRAFFWTAARCDWFGATNGSPPCLWPSTRRD